MKHSLLTLVLLFTLATPAFTQSKGTRNLTDTKLQRYDLSARASEIDSRTKEHPEIGFAFNDVKGKPKDLQHAVGDTVPLDPDCGINQ